MFGDTSAVALIRASNHQAVIRNARSAWDSCGSFCRCALTELWTLLIHCAGAARRVKRKTTQQQQLRESLGTASRQPRHRREIAER